MSEYIPPSGPHAPSDQHAVTGGPTPPSMPGAPDGHGSAVIPPMMRPPPSDVPTDISGKKIAAGLCAILIGSLGIHKFILGYTNAGVIMLLVTILTCGIGGTVMWIIGIIEGITYLTKTDEEFYRTYVVQQKTWF